jgi:hypothetical protein
MVMHIVTRCCLHWGIAGNTDSDVRRVSSTQKDIFKTLCLLGILHITMRIAVSCVLPRSPNLGIHRCKYQDSEVGLSDDSVNCCAGLPDGHSKLADRSKARMAPTGDD